MQALRKVAPLVLAASLALTAAACSSSDDGADPARTSTTAGGKVDVDVSSDNPSVEYTDPDGNTSQYGDGADLPEGWPAALAPPGTVTLVSSSTSSADGETKLFVTGESTAAFDQLYTGVKSQLEAAGFTITNDIGPGTEGGTPGFAGVEAASDAFAASISISEDTGTKKVTILYTLTPTS
jgi:uncharacterized lipoprotein